MAVSHVAERCGKLQNEIMLAIERIGHDLAGLATAKTPDGDMIATVRTILRGYALQLSALVGLIRLEWKIATIEEYVQPRTGCPLCGRAQSEVQSANYEETLQRPNLGTFKQESGGARPTVVLRAVEDLKEGESVCVDAASGRVSRAMVSAEGVRKNVKDDDGRMTPKVADEEAVAESNAKSDSEQHPCQVADNERRWLVWSGGHFEVYVGHDHPRVFARPDGSMPPGVPGCVGRVCIACVQQLLPPRFQGQTSFSPRELPTQIEWGDSPHMRRHLVWAANCFEVYYQESGTIGIVKAAVCIDCVRLLLPDKYHEAPVSDVQVLPTRVNAEGDESG